VNASTAVIEEAQSNVGAVVMGRNMFGGGPGPWSEDPPWKGWWGDDPPYHVPTFVLTHHAREPQEMDGGTTFFFVTDGIGSALEQAQQAAGDKDVLLGGGASVIQQYFAAGLVDEFWLHVAPILLDDGERCSRTSAIWRSSRCARSRHPASPTSGTASSGDSAPRSPRSRSGSVLVLTARSSG
jgi:dihydrofolate reductase